MSEDRDTDGHVDLIAAFTAPGEVLLQTAPQGEDRERMEENRRAARGRGPRRAALEALPHVYVAGDRVAMSYMNFYVCNGAVIVPLAELDMRRAGAGAIADAYPGREVVGVPGRGARVRRRRAALHHPAGSGERRLAPWSHA